MSNAAAHTETISNCGAVDCGGESCTPCVCDLLIEGCGSVECDGEACTPCVCDLLDEAHIDETVCLTSSANVENSGE